MIGSTDESRAGSGRTPSGLASSGVNLLIGTSPAILKLEQEIERAARCHAKVLITGESGVGKDLVANLIHQRSPRRRAPMVTVNCAAFPESLLESELFGHQRGSFTGAFRDKPGRFEAADQGTLFLDEVCDMSLRMQALLLRFLETGETRRVGADGPPTRVDVRVIAASNKDMQQCVSAGEFREALFFRLNVLGVGVPPLRDRRDDIPALLAHFLGVYSAERGIPVPSVAPSAMDRLTTYQWPGNVRELRNIVESAVMQVATGVIRLADLPERIRETAPQRTATMGPASAVLSVAQRLYDRMTLGGESFWTVVYDPFMARDISRDDVRETVRLGLERVSGRRRLLVEHFNMQPADYQRFLGFLRSFDCKPASYPIPNVATPAGLTFHSGDWPAARPAHPTRPISAARH